MTPWGPQTPFGRGPKDGRKRKSAGRPRGRRPSCRGGAGPFNAIGTVRHAHREVPRHWSISKLKGRLVLARRYAPGLRDIRRGQRIVVLFRFHRSPPFTRRHLAQRPPRRDRDMGVFSTCSPVRPNPVGLSVVKVLRKSGSELLVSGIDMLDGTPILDIKPHKG